MNPHELGLRTQYTVENVSDRRLVKQQLEAYIRRGYLKEVSVSEKVYLSPLLPVKKPNGTYRFTNDFRKLNSYFQGIGTMQVDVWRKLWEIDPAWRFCMEIDLKDGFFGVSVDDTLSRLFGFTFGDRRFRWVRLPQGWLWSSVLFGERIAEIIRGIGCPQYSDNVLVGAETPKLLLEKALEIFQRFDRFGIKVNFEKVKCLSTEISFLGYEIKDGKISLEKYLQDRMKEVGVVKGIEDLERIIGILSYARRTVKNVEVILHSLREDPRKMKNEGDF